MTKKKQRLTPVSVLIKYLKATRGYGFVPDEPLVATVASILAAREGIPRTGNARAFIEAHSSIIRRDAKLVTTTTSKTKPDALERQKANPARLQATEDRLEPAVRHLVAGIDVTSNEFLQTYEWRSLRMRVLKRWGSRCLCCGASPATGAVMNVDHIKPRKLFPELALDESNLQPLCSECNHGKGNWDMTDWRPTQGAVP